MLRRGRQQEVTGVVVNDKPGVDRQTLKRFRALLHQVEKTGPEGKRWGSGGDVLASAVGFANYVAMVDPVKGKALQHKALALARRYGPRPPPPSSPPPPPSGKPVAAAPAVPPPAPVPSAPAPSPPADEPKPEEPPKKKWWKVF